MQYMFAFAYFAQSSIRSEHTLQCTNRLDTVARIVSIPTAGVGGRTAAAAACLLHPQHSTARRQHGAVRQ